MQPDPESGCKRIAIIEAVPDSRPYGYDGRTGSWYIDHWLEAEGWAHELRRDDVVDLLGNEPESRGAGRFAAKEVLRRFRAVLGERQKSDADGKVDPVSRSASDKKSEQRKKNRRAMNVEAVDCARRFKAAKAAGDGTTTMQGIVEDYAAEMEADGRPVSVSATTRILNDNPEQWKD